MTASPTRLCKGCGEVKDFVRGTWVWSSIRGAMGSVCMACRSKACSNTISLKKKTDDAFKTRHNANKREWHQNKLATDPDFRLKVNAQSLTYNKAKYHADPEYRAARHAYGRDHSSKKYASNNEFRQYVRAKNSAWRVNNKDRAAAFARNYKAAKLNRTPGWLNEDDFWLMEQAYKLAQMRNESTGLKWHVDHIIPLQGTNVSGLHVPTNLQVIPAKANLSKGAKWAPV